MAKRNIKVQTILTKDALLKGNLKREYVPLPQIGGGVYVRELGGKSLILYRGRIEQLQTATGDENPELNVEQSLDLMSYLVSLTVCDEDGKLMFTEDEAKELQYGSFAVLETLAEKAMEVSGISKTAIDGVKSQLKNAEASSLSTDS